MLLGNNSWTIANSFVWKILPSLTSIWQQINHRYIICVDVHCKLRKKLHIDVNSRIPSKIHFSISLKRYLVPNLARALSNPARSDCTVSIFGYLSPPLNSFHRESFRSNSTCFKKNRPLIDWYYDTVFKILPVCFYTGCGKSRQRFAQHNLTWYELWYIFVLAEEIDRNCFYLLYEERI